MRKVGLYLASLGFLCLLSAFSISGASTMFHPSPGDVSLTAPMKFTESIVVAPATDEVVKSEILKTDMISTCPVGLSARNTTNRTCPDPVGVSASVGSGVPTFRNLKVPWSA